MLFYRSLAVAFVVSVVPFVSQAEERESGGFRAPVAIEVVFSSPGNGIDGETQDAILSLASDEIRGGRLAALTVKPWGHEGERTLCLQFRDPVYVRTVEARIQELVRHGNQASGFGKTSAALVLNCVGPAPRPNE